MQYVRDAWYVAGWSPELEAEKPVALTILGEPIVIYKTPGGRLVALENRCVHRLAALSLGRCEGEQLRCMYHGLLFNPEGKVVQIPGQDLIPETARVRSYPLVDKHSWLWVWMGDADAADPALIPRAVGFDDPNWILGHGDITYEAEASLLNDNLLDFSHVSYVHAESFQVTEAWANTRPDIIPLDRGIRVQRWIESETGLPGTGTEDILFDKWLTYDYLVPGILLMTSGNFPVGTAKEYGFGPPDLEQAENGVMYSSQAVTPASNGKCRYFFSIGPHVDHGNEAMRDGMIAVQKNAFEEDRVMIEAQQQIIDLTPDPRIMPTSADKGVVLFNRLVAKLARHEGHADQPHSMVS